MQTATEVIQRLRDEIGEQAFKQLTPVLEGGGIDLERLRRYFLKADYWATLKRNEGQVTKTLENIAVNYDLCIRSIRYIVYK